MPEASEPPERPVAPVAREPVQRWRLVLAREPLGSDATQRDQLAAWDEALRRSGLPLAGLDLDPPRPRFAIAAPLGAALSGEAELADVYLVERVPAWRVREALDHAVPAGYALQEAFDIWLGEAALPGQVVASVYRVPVRAEPGLDDACRALMNAATIERERMKGSGPVRYDLRPFIEALEVGPADGNGDATVRMTLRHDPARGVGRPDEVLAAIGGQLGHDIAPAPGALVRERLVLAPPAAPAPPRPRGPRRPGQPATPPSRPRK
ncbi:MAG TPA: DUF2344 domain-containing protein [Candidatus Limnocylindrales bacterium]|nr:DUF2344 domain-containing protein [Candidatus Limnocylindrales bacterium]